MNQALLEKLKELVSPMLAEAGVELIDLIISGERGKTVLRFLVDRLRSCTQEGGRAGGITLDECARLNQEIGQLLEGENLLEQSYLLEVSSPGLDRPLESTRDFQRVQGQLIKIVLHQPVSGQNVWTGYLDEVEEENVIIQTERQQKLCIRRSNIARAHLEVRV